MSAFVFRADIRLHFCLALCSTACEKYLALKNVEIVFVFSTVDICHLQEKKERGGTQQKITDTDARDESNSCSC